MREHVIHLFFLVIFLSSLSNSETINYMPTLHQDEKRFENKYGWNDFHLGWKVTYFDVVRYSTLPNSDGKIFKLPKKLIFETIFQAGDMPSEGLNEKSMRYLAKAVLTPAYFWKHQLPLIFSYTVYSLRFIDADDGRLKAVETRDEVRQFLGKIDTPAELSLWLLASESPYVTPYSFMKKGDLYRVRFFDDDIFTCTYHEYFKYYNAQGKVVKVKEIQKIRYEIPCPEIAI